MSEAIGLPRWTREILEAKLREQATLQALLAQQARRSMSWSRRRARCSTCRPGGSWRIRAWVCGAGEE